ncbi:MAG: hypothetical protein QME81_10890 [bacterium]|nr:hypothetical protein [bacterium]
MEVWDEEWDELLKDVTGDEKYIPLEEMERLIEIDDCRKEGSWLWQLRKSF